MSADENRTSVESKLEALQCHFTWDINLSRATLLRFREKLENIGPEEGNWLGHSYNLQGYIHHKLDLNEDAKSFFSRAAEAFHQRKTDDGPWLMVNYGNQAWLHHHLGEEAESQTYLSKVDALMNEYPPPSQDELHAEVYAEKAWTLTKFSRDKTLVVDYFERAIRMQKEMVEWKTTYVIAIMISYKFKSTGMDHNFLEKMRNAKEQDPENLYLAVHYLDQCARNKEKIEDDARELAQKILRNPVSSYSGIKALLMLYMKYLSPDEAIDLAEEALQKHPDERYLKRCAALCYTSKVIYSRDPQQNIIDRAVSLVEEVISLYPHSSLVKKIDLANIYAKSNQGLAKAEQIYQELLKSDLEPADRQMLYNYYAKHLNHDRHDRKRSIEYHMKAAEIPVQSFFRENSIEVLEKIKDPHSSPVKKIDLANIYAKSNQGLAEAEQIYQELLKSDLEPADRQMLYNQYAKHLFFDRRDHRSSIEYHMKAAKIPEQSFYRENSIKNLEKIKDRNRSSMCRNIEVFLANLQES